MRGWASIASGAGANWTYRVQTLDIDHCLPWSAWPCGDLWNLLPASRHANQRLKKDRLPSASALAAARERILWRGGAIRPLARVSTVRPQRLYPSAPEHLQTG